MSARHMVEQVIAGRDPAQTLSEARSKHSRGMRPGSVKTKAEKDEELTEARTMRPPKSIRLPSTHLHTLQRWRAFQDERLLKQRLGGSYPNWDVGQDPTNTEAHAIKAGEDAAERYRNSQWPGGMASVVGVIEWEDGEGFSYVVNRYSSPS
jgi:hypothetical protein